MQEFFRTYGKELIALAVPLLTWALNTFFKSRTRLLVANPHAFTFLVQEPLSDPQGQLISPTQTINTCAFALLNAGKETATRVEVVFNWQPKCLNIWPPRRYQGQVEPDGRYTVTLDSLAPREDVGFHVFSINSDLPAFILARCDQCLAQPIQMAPQPVVSAWRRRTLVFLAFTGLASVVYAVIVLLQFLVLRTPQSI